MYIYIYIHIWGFLSHGGPPKSPKSVMDNHLGIETYGDFGIPDFQKSPHQFHKLMISSYVFIICIYDIC